MQEALDKAVELDPPNAGRYYYNLGAVLTNMGQTDAACKAFKKAIDDRSQLRRRALSVRYLLDG